MADATPDLAAVDLMADPARKEADVLWEVIAAAFHYGDGHQSAFEQLVSEMRASRTAQSDLAALKAENERLKAEVTHRKAMQPMDRDGRPITQAPANRLLIAYYDDLLAARTEVASLRERLAAAEAALKVMTKRAIAARTTQPEERDE